MTEQLCQTFWARWNETTQHQNGCLSLRGISMSLECGWFQEIRSEICFITFQSQKFLLHVAPTRKHGYDDEAARIAAWLLR